MNRKMKFIFGMLLIIFGGAWLLSSFGIRLFSFSGFYRAFSYLWPLILVGVGVKMSFSKKLSNIVWGLLLIAFIVCSIFYTQFGVKREPRNFFNNFDNYDYNFGDDWFGNDFSPY